MIQICEGWSLQALQSRVQKAKDCFKATFHLSDITWFWQKVAFNSSVNTACSVLLNLKSGLLWWSLVDMFVWSVCQGIPICLKRIRGRLGSSIRFLPPCYLELVLNPCLQTAWSEVNRSSQGDTWGTVYIHPSEGSMLSRGNAINIKRVSLSTREFSTSFSGGQMEEESQSSWEVQMSISFWTGVHLWRSS